MRFFNKRNFIGGSMALIAMVAVGFVYAAWTTNGSGSGYAKAGAATGLSTVTATTSGTLVPGGTAAVTVKIVNTNAFPVRVTDVALNGTNADITSDDVGCTTTGVSFTDQHGLTLDVPANSAAGVQFTLNGAAAMSNASVNACQGDTFTIPVSLTGASNAP